MNHLILGILLLYIFTHLVYILHFLVYPNPKIKIVNHLPVTILIAVRNEEKNLTRLIESLNSQNYPKELVEVIIGNDQSEDNSYQILKEYEKIYSWIKIINIEKKIGNLKGKQNVLAHLVPLATHENILITDADIQLPPEWIKTMVSYLQNYDMISAPTIVQGNRLFHQLQGLDWLFSISVIKPFSDWGLPITAVGNNMGFKKSEYMKFGGYEKLPFSLTEDYILFEKMILKDKGKFQWVHLPEVLNISQPIEDLSSFFNQRKRWFEGAKKGPWYAILIFIHHVLIYPTLFLGFLLFSFPFALCLFLMKWIIDFLWLWTACAAIKKTYLLKNFLLFQVYFILITLILPFYFLISRKVIWKGRIYD